MGNPASNTFDCFREFVGKKVVGVLQGALPVGRRDIASGTKTLVFEDGRGLTVASNGSYWIDSKEDVDRAVSEVTEELEKLRRDTEDVLRLAGRA